MAPNTKEAKSGEMMWHTPKENPKSSGTPLARSGHTIVAANEKAYLFGGCGIEEGQAAVFQDLWILHISDQFRWEKCDAMGDVPSPRWRHTCTFLPDNATIFLFGGLCRVRLSPSPRLAADRGSKGAACLTLVLCCSPPRARISSARSALLRRLFPLNSPLSLPPPLSFSDSPLS